ncbi:MAG: hypothetical protein AAGC68_02290 [Verrucomicrobiota bacterium]
MNKQQLIATFWLVLLFGSGLLVGMSLSPTSAKGTGIGQSRTGKPPEQRWVEHHRNLLVSELDLTNEQLALIDPVYSRTTERLRGVRETMVGSIKEAVRSTRRDLMQILTPEQVERFKVIRLGGDLGEDLDPAS